MSAVHAQFSGTAKQVLEDDLELVEDGEHVVVAVDKEKEVKPKEELKKKGMKQAPREDYEGTAKREDKVILL